MGTSNAYSSNSSWTPLGILASHLGTTPTSILPGIILLGEIPKAALIFMGQTCLLCGDFWKNLESLKLLLFLWGKPVFCVVTFGRI
jgi:hypothetical protein